MDILRLTIIGTVILIIWIFLIVSCGEQPTDDDLPVECGTGLAAIDLAGTCRAQPKATMGALEVQI